MILESAEDTLRQRLKDGTMEALQAAVCVSEVLKGLEELHKWKVVHLDLKPENIFRVKDRRTKDTVARIRVLAV
jgi:serine/threonine protein kinase